jgi:hypothetical protein
MQDKLLANKACAPDLPKDTSTCNGQSINVDRRQKQVCQLANDSICSTATCTGKHCMIDGGFA